MELHAQIEGQGDSFDEHEERQEGLVDPHGDGQDDQGAVQGNPLDDHE